MPDTVRRAMSDDIERLVSLFDDYRRFYGKPSEPTVARRFLTERMASGESVLLIAENVDGAAIGFVQLYPTFSSIHAAPIYLLSDLYVAPSARRRGVGTMLIKAAAETGLDGGAVQLELSTAVTNVPAQTLYKRLGWKRDEEFYVYTLPLRP